MGTGCESKNRPGRGRSRRAMIATVAAVAVVAAIPAAAAFTAGSMISGSAVAAHPGNYPGNHPESRAISGGVIANLFEWNWASVGKECTSVLGPAGYAAVQVAPPQDSTKRTALGNGSDTVLHPWWEVYQPVSYSLTSRMGNEAQFKAMVSTCRKAGVKVIVDAVINHMTGQGSTSYGGRTFTKYNYAGLYSPADFHSSPANCPIAPNAGSGDQNGTIADFNSYTQVFNCELVGLSDLDTGSAKVRNTIAAYLNKLLGYGVSGFRVDAAKHIGQTDLGAIESRLHRTVDGAKPYIALEVGAGSPGVISPAAFEKQGSLLGFDYASALQSAFRSYTDTPGGNIGDLKVFGESAGLLPSNKSLAFVVNHDTERSTDPKTLNYKNDAYYIAHEFMLAYGYGTPAVYASFAWNATDDSPPSDANGMVTNTDCGKGWVCTDRNLGVKNMVGWHNEAKNAPVANWWDDGNNLAAFSRGHRAFIVINNEAVAKAVTVQTGLPGGKYCDIIHGTVTNGHCSGPTVTVNGNGKATITVPSKDSVALYRLSKV